MARKSLPKMLLRGAFRRCPWCGGPRAFFTGWFSKAPNCATCGLRWRRGDVGFELGAAAMAAIITLGPLIIALGIVLVAMWPDIPTVLLMTVFLPGALLLPLITYPLSYTMWQAVDLLMRPVTTDDFDASHVFAGTGLAQFLPDDLDT